MFFHPNNLNSFAFKLLSLKQQTTIKVQNKTLIVGAYYESI